MRRLPVAAFVTLVVATIAAFFVTQHLKVTTPLVAGDPGPFPEAISPAGTGCGGFHRVAQFSFYLLHRADDVNVYVVDESGDIVRTLALGRHMRTRPHPVRDYFPWNGREDTSALAPSGTYYFRVDLIHQGRTFELTNKPITVINTPPHPVVTDVTPSVVVRSGTLVTIHYSGSENRAGTVRIYRTDLPGPPRLVKSFLALGQPRTRAVWDGRINGRPAPQGTYLIGFDVTDPACNTGRFPTHLPPAPGSTPHAGVSVRYLAAAPPVTPVTAGSRVLVYVDAAQGYRWSLQRAGTRAAIAGGASRQHALSVPVPPAPAGLYELTIHSGPYGTTVPIVAAAAASRRILVVLPALTWLGQDPVDDTGDGIPTTLDTGGPVQLDRPLASGLPPGLGDETSLLAYLDRSHLPYDLTTDLGLIDGTGPQLSGHAGVVLAGTERWLPVSLGSALRAYVRGGGHVLSLGVDSLRRGVIVTAGQAKDPTNPVPVDVLGAKAGPLVTGNRKPISSLVDGLRIFVRSAATLRGYESYEPIVAIAAPGRIASQAGASRSAPTIVGFRLGRGVVIEIGLPGFGSSLARNAGAQELVRRLWSVLSP